MDAESYEALAAAQHDLERAQTRLRMLVEASMSLASSLDPEESLQRLARVVLPHMADACVIHLVQGERIRLVAASHHGSGRFPPADDEEREWPWPSRSDTPLAWVLRGAGPRVVDISEERGGDGALWEATVELGNAAGASTALIVPVEARREVLGALTLLSSGTPEGFDDQTLDLAFDLAHRAALAVENDRLFAQQRSIAEQLQLSLLPELSGLKHVPLTARYVPAHEGAEVGGDWYDAFLLPDKTTMLAIGDVVGHDLRAAVRMGQLRNMLRALAYDSGDSPAGVMRRLDRAMQGLSSTELVTGVIAQLDASSTGPWLLRWTNAGHPPPVLITPTGESELLEAGLAPVLGVDPATQRSDTSVPLQPGSTLLLYTDGLIERPGESLTWGLARLRQHTASLAGLPLDKFCDELLGRLAEGRQDDVAILALRVPDTTDEEADAQRE
ncbi:GAF domain-containing SpoIIE family protein phosphatase [Streptomyces sp. NPDC047046]|uniref:PP2C family protein-serine/threonine phosphatase n=1 Tax=Streptomyces sp. NPDC047046 TaxID=3155378 RepID=UPI0033D82C49